LPLGGDGGAVDFRRTARVDPAVLFFKNAIWAIPKCLADDSGQTRSEVGRTTRSGETKWEKGFMLSQGKAQAPSGQVMPNKTGIPFTI
jgi:hypothetical protein